MDIGKFLPILNAYSFLDQNLQFLLIFQRSVWEYQLEIPILAGFRSFLTRMAN